MQMIQFYLLLPQASYSKVINFSLTCAFWVVGGGGTTRTEPRSDVLTSCYITNVLKTGPLGGQLFLFTLNLNFFPWFSLRKH